MQYFAERIGGDRVEVVTTIVRPGVRPTRSNSRRGISLTIDRGLTS